MLKVLKSLQKTMWGNILILGAVTLLILGGLWLVRHGNGEETAAGDASLDEESTQQVSAVDVPDSDAAAPEVGKEAPVFSAHTLDGEDISLKDLDKPVWLNFNATWCSNCRAEMPDVSEAEETFGDDIDIVTVYVDDAPTTVASYVHSLGLTNPQVVDNSGSVGSLYRVAGVPSHYFINTDGTLESIDVGVLSPSTMEERIDAVLQD